MDSRTHTNCLLCLLIPLLVLLTGCLDIEQTLTVKNDGSGTLEVRYIFDEEALDLQDYIDPEEDLFTESELLGMIDTNRVTLSHLNETRENGLRIVEMVYAFKHIELLAKRWCDDHNTIHFEHMDDRGALSWDYATGEEPKDEPDDAMAEIQELFADHYCRFTVILPYRITEADQAAHISQDGHSAQWEFPLCSFMKGDTISLNAVFEK